MSYAVQPVVNRTDLKPKTFKSEKSALRFMLKVLDQHNLQVRNIIERPDSVEEYVCEDSASRIIMYPVQ